MFESLFWSIKPCSCFPKSDFEINSNINLCVLVDLQRSTSLSIGISVRAIPIGLSLLIQYHHSNSVLFTINFENSDYLLSKEIRELLSEIGLIVVTRQEGILWGHILDQQGVIRGNHVSSGTQRPVISRISSGIIHPASSQVKFLTFFAFYFN